MLRRLVLVALSIARRSLRLEAKIAGCNSPLSVLRQLTRSGTEEDNFGEEHACFVDAESRVSDE